MTHVGYIASAYGVVILVIVSLAVWIYLDRRAQIRALAEVDSRRMASRQPSPHAKTPESAARS